MNTNTGLVLGVGSLICQWVALDCGLEHPVVHAAAVFATCKATPVSTTPFRRLDLRNVPWLAAAPSSAGITGHLFFRHPGARGAEAELHTGGEMPGGASTKILWLIDNPDVGVALQITGRNLTGSGVMHQTFAGSREVPSIIRIPTPGCWELQLRSGKVQGTVTMPVA